MCKIDRVIVLTKERRKKKVSRFIPLSIPNFEGNERKYVDDAIDQGWVSTGGAYITCLLYTSISDFPGADNRRSNAEDRCECEGDSFYYQYR